MRTLERDWDEYGADGDDDGADAPLAQPEMSVLEPEEVAQERAQFLMPIPIVSPCNRIILDEAAVSASNVSRTALPPTRKHTHLLNYVGYRISLPPMIDVTAATRSSSNMSAQPIQPQAPYPAADKAEMVIRSVTPSITTFSLPFERGPVHFGMRCTAVRLRTGSVAVFSPCPLTPTVVSTLTSLANNNVRYIISPDMEHHIHITEWKKAYPNAYILASEGLREKRIRQGYNDAETGGAYAHTWTRGPNMRTDDGKYGTVIPQEFKDEFDVEYFHPHPNRDVAFLHRPDGGTLIQADLFFNLPANEQYAKSGINPRSGLITKLATAFLTLPSKANNYTANGQRRFHWWVLARANRKAYAESAKVTSGWQFTRIIPCHGDVVEDDAKRQWDETLRWFLDMTN
ncbi:hypothetical protein BDZ91DRAFT_798997 [Kalaharituber pfeilii]|nr:hypothetical protein BDZ91DRAFT_798997 [Kalaharituber pfeilii]